MIKDNRGKKVTPNQMAKILIDDSLEITKCYWDEKFTYTCENSDETCTKREREQIQIQLDKRIQGVRRYLGLRD